MIMNAPQGAYERQLLIERAGMYNSADLRAHEEKEHEDVALWECAHHEGVTPQGERCNLTAERNEKGEIVVPAACATCALATYAVLQERRRSVEQVREDAQNFVKMLDARANA